MGGEYDLSVCVLSKDRWAVTAYPEAEPVLAQHPLHLPPRHSVTLPCYRKL